jgi:hypothetical protein
MAGEIKEIAESSVSLGDIVVFLSAARDMAQAGERIKMDDAIRRAERAFSSLRSDCRVICEIREDERCTT